MCFRVSFEFIEYYVILGILGVLWQKIKTTASETWGGSPGDPRQFFAPRGSARARGQIFFSPPKNMYEMMNLHGCYVKPGKTVPYLTQGCSESALTFAFYLLGISIFAQIISYFMTSHEIY